VLLFKVTFYHQSITIGHFYFLLQRVDLLPLDEDVPVRPKRVHSPSLPQESSAPDHSQTNPNMSQLAVLQLHQALLKSHDKAWANQGAEVSAQIGYKSHIYVDFLDNIKLLRN
jgi:hypothetical protein